MSDIRAFFGGKPEKSSNDMKKSRRGTKTSSKKRIADETESSVPTKRSKKLEEKIPIVDLDSNIESEPEESLISQPLKRKQSSKSEVQQSRKPKIQLPPKPDSTEPPLDFRGPNEKLEQWVDKYRPIEMKNIVGQHMDQSPANKLLSWLKDWPRNNLDSTTTKKSGASGNAAKNDGSIYRAALLSGPPGIGKTTTAQLVCQELGLRYTELNASVARSKKILEQKVSQLIHSRRLDEYFGAKPGEQKPVIKSKKGIRLTHVLIMDEVDGMSGNQDRAGVAELIQLIKKSEIPVICICNDRQSQKVRSLANHCFDLRFQRPRTEQILGKMMTIAAREKLKVSKQEIEQIINAASQDMRQSIYSLQLMASGKDSSGVLPIKDVSINIFEAARQLLSAETDILKKRELFFTDYNIMPLFVQENYLRIRSSISGRNGQMRAYCKAAESICMGEMVSRQIWSSQNWSLLPLQGMFSAVLPPLHVKGQMMSQVSFPAWLGKQSNQGKRLRLLRELDEHMGIRISGPLNALSIDYIPMIRNAILRSLAREDDNSVKDALEVYHAYNLIKEDLETINELGMWNENGDLWKRIKPAVKASLTRALGKDTHKKHFSTTNDIQIKARTGTAKRGAAKASKDKIKAIAAEEEEPDQKADNSLGDDEGNEVQAEILDAY